MIKQSTKIIGVIMETSWKEIIDKWCQCGQPQSSKWCEKQQIPYRAFLQWRKKLCVDEIGQPLFIQRQSPKKKQKNLPFPL